MPWPARFVPLAYCVEEAFTNAANFCGIFADFLKFIDGRTDVCDVDFNAPLRQPIRTPSRQR
jgi:hypothetical protein